LCTFLFQDSLMNRKFKRTAFILKFWGGICIHQGWIKCIKSYSNDIYSVTKDYIL